MKEEMTEPERKITRKEWFGTLYSKLKEKVVLVEDEGLRQAKIYYKNMEAYRERFNRENGE